jgi:putative tryptophan/tyrosine transport system substrate-binding protein
MRRMPRFAALLATFLAVAPAVAQTDDRIWRLGVLSPGESPAIRNVTLTELARQGFAEGRNLVVEERVGTTDRLPALARELVRTKPDAVIAVSNGAIRALREATKTIPIVMSFIGEDPVAAGIVTSLTRPGGNITGQVMLAPELDGKRLHLLHEAVPAARRIGVLAADPVRHKLNTADFVVRIFRGVPPGELPIEGPTRYAFAINLKTARALRLELPSTLLPRANEVIE